MTGFEALILGIVEGITEFLPVSSTFHLVGVARLLGLNQSEFQKLFEVVIQSGAILAVIAAFARTIRREPALIKKVLVAFVPTAVLGFLLYRVIKDVVFENIVLQLAAFLIVGILLILFERAHRRIPLTRSPADISYGEALLIGIAQSFALVPGVSRAGAVMLILLYLHVRREEAARFSFLLAVPTILAASAFDLYQTRSLALTNQELLTLGIGFVAAFVTALVAVKWLIRYLQNHTLAAFGWYRVVVIAGVLAVWVLSKSF